MNERHSTFETRVLEDLATLKQQVKDLVGNGQPGRIAHIEAKVRRHERLIWITAGFALAGGYGISEIVKKIFGG